MKVLRNLIVIHGLTEIDRDSKIFLVCRTNLSKGEVKSIIKQHFSTTQDTDLQNFRHSDMDIIDFISIDIDECV